VGLGARREALAAAIARRGHHQWRAARSLVERARAKFLRHATSSGLAQGRGGSLSSLAHRLQESKELSAVGGLARLGAYTSRPESTPGASTTQRYAPNSQKYTHFFKFRVGTDIWRPSLVA
jgi:hypothetical protein